VRLDTSSGRWMIKEMANMHYYPRRDIDFIEVHVKDFIFDAFSYGKLGWNVDIHKMVVVDIANKNLDPGVAHIDASSVTWTMKEAFYVEVEFDYVHNLGVLPMSGKGTIYLHCDNAQYRLAVQDTSVKPTITCGTWLYKDIKIRSGVAWESIKNHIVATFNTDTQLQSKFVNTFAKIMEKYYYEEYRDKTGSIEFTDLKTKINVFFAWTSTKTNIKDNTLEFDYTIKFTSVGSDKVMELPYHPIIADAPDAYSRMYFVDKQLIMDVANVILPKYINQPIFNNDIPKDSYWQLKLWNLQKVLPDVLMINDNQDNETFTIYVDYVPQLSTPKLDVVKHFSDFPYYRVSGLIFNATFILYNTTTPLLKATFNLSADLTPSVTETAKDNKITVSFTATTGRTFVLNAWEEEKVGGFIFYRGLDEFLSEGLNDYFIKQLGHYAFGSGLSFEDFAHKGGISYVEPREDGVYIYLD
jgi:hypothetical protein